MQRTLLVATASLTVTSAFVTAPLARVRTVARSTEQPTEPTAETPEPVAVAAPVVLLNGWAPNSELACFGLPGALAPTGYFDPLGFAQPGISLNDVKRNRESEVMHGRVAMLACVGYVVGESFGGPFGLGGPANDQLSHMPLPAFAALSLFIGIAETYRATVGWVEPGAKSLWTLRDNYYPGDVGFDPLGLKPTDAFEFQVMQTKELQNGRLAMIGAAGMCMQELMNHKTLFETYDFYSKVYSGVDPYAGLEL